MAFRQTALRFQLNRIVVSPIIKYRFTQMSASVSSTAGSENPSQTPPEQQQQHARSRPTQGELAEQIMASPDFPHFPLIDIAINLTDRSFEKVKYI